MLHPLSVSSVVPFIVAAAAQREGVDAAALLGAASVTTPRADEHISAEAYFEFWRRAVAHIPDASFPLRAASLFQLEDHEVFGFLAMSCETLGQAYERTAAFRALYCSGARWELVVEDHVVRLIWYPWPGSVNDPGYRAAMDFTVADMAKAIRQLSGAAPRPTAVCLAHAAPAELSNFVDFYGVEPTFHSPLYELHYAPGLPDLPVATFNSRLRDYFDEECRRLVASMPSDANIVAQVRKQLISAMDGGDSAMETIARQLGLSERTLQRRLTDEHTRYIDVLSDVRTEFAKRYLARGTVTASEVAYLIGFTEPPAFFKAFKRWTGMTPREFQLGAAT